MWPLPIRCSSLDISSLGVTGWIGGSERPGLFAWTQYKGVTILGVGRKPKCYTVDLLERKIPEKLGGAFLSQTVIVERAVQEYWDKLNSKKV